MDTSELKTKVLAEIQRVPEARLSELYDFIRDFRSRFEPDLHSRQPIDFAGCWSDLPLETYTEFLEDIAQRRQHSESCGEYRETSLD
jgi:hypothetical protein